MIDDVYVRILKYVKEKGQVTRQELEKQFPEQKDLIGREMEHNRLLSPLNNRWGLDDKFSLTFEDNFRLMEYEELVEARKSSKFAIWVAIISISLNIAALTYSVFSTSDVRLTNIQELNAVSKK